MIYYVSDCILDIEPLTVEDLLNAPKIPRTHTYIQPPIKYDICCPICGAYEPEKFTYSEFEKHYWCYKCEKDIIIPWKYAGIFSGPIPIQTAMMFGTRFERVNVHTGEIVDHPIDPSKSDYKEKLGIYNSTWVHNEELKLYDIELDKKIVTVKNLNKEGNPTT